MAPRILYWHIGLADPACDSIGATLAATDGGEVLLAASPDEGSLLTLELRRDHKRYGLRRAEVAGVTHRVCDRIWRHKGTSVLSTPGVCAADKDQLRLALDALHGVEVHLVITVPTLREQVYGAWVDELRCGAGVGFTKYAERVLGDHDHRQREQFKAGHDLGAIIERWGWTLRTERIHLLYGGGWDEFAALVGLSGPVVPTAPVAPRAAALLRQLNKQAEAALDRDDVTRILSEQAPVNALPPVGREYVDAAIDSWTGLTTPHVVGSPAALRDVDGVLPMPDEAGSVAVDRLVDVLVDNARLRAEIKECQARLEKVERKSRKLKRRLKG